MVEMKNKLPAAEGNPETNQNNNQQQQNQTATRTVKVSVVEKANTENKIGSANIMIGTKTGHTGQNGGQATISDVPEGTQTITVTATGYKSYTGSIVVGASMDDPVVIELEEE